MEGCGSCGGCWDGCFVVDEYGGGVIGNRKGFTGGECGECGASEAEGAAVVGVCGGEVMTSIDGFFHETATVFAAPNRVLVF